jgi:dTMP kinase
MDMSKAKFIVIDGIDGCGKTTMISLMEKKLSEKYSVFTTAEPSQGPIGQVLRQFLKNNKVSANIDALLFAADRLWHIENEILPNLNKYDFILSDRYIVSSIAYQSAQKGKIDGSFDEWVKELNKFAIPADLYIVLDIEPAEAMKRRPNFNEKFENAEFLTHVRKIFLNSRKMNDYAKQYIIIPSTTIEETAQKIFEEIVKLKN